MWHCDFEEWSWSSRHISAVCPKKKNIQLSVMISHSISRQLDPNWSKKTNTCQCDENDMTETIFVKNTCALWVFSLPHVELSHHQQDVSPVFSHQGTIKMFWHLIRHCQWLLWRANKQLHLQLCACTHTRTWQSPLLWSFFFRGKIWNRRSHDTLHEVTAATLSAFC